MMNPVLASAEGSRCDAVERARVQMRQLPREQNPSSEFAAGAARNRALATIFRTAAAESVDPIVRDRAAAAAAGFDQWADFLGTATGTEDLATPRGQEALTGSLTPIVALEGVCPIPG
ncbi:hypothetical protein FZI91_07660 [Mycobacterium sp. CBMA271]|uniref:hypothetical protein n=2 Tax=unclassified Mycobacteroides TaxID=2618759 RepID=UPI0012DD83C1|nr:hypothetical protein [Mycobacteroides sp. CBMA 271]MUM19168.1 hypothetical protein [Mycobacteroides sp. CBMA 326]MUM21582.1 hypothetical protein [Mycobacteroides sp. CBMA 271]